MLTYFLAHLPFWVLLNILVNILFSLDRKEFMYTHSKMTCSTEYPPCKRPHNSLGCILDLSTLPRVKWFHTFDIIYKSYHSYQPPQKYFYQERIQKLVAERHNIICYSGTAMSALMSQIRTMVLQSGLHDSAPAGWSWHCRLSQPQFPLTQVLCLSQIHVAQFPFGITKDQTLIL